MGLVGVSDCDTDSAMHQKSGSDSDATVYLEVWNKMWPDKCELSSQQNPENKRSGNVMDGRDHASRLC